MENVYNIEGVKCAGCVATVKEKLSNVAGVESVDVNIADKKLTVVGNADKEKLQQALTETKYEIK